MTISRSLQLICILVPSLVGCMDPMGIVDEYPMMTGVGGATVSTTTTIRTRGGATFVTTTRPVPSRGGAPSVTSVEPTAATCVAPRLLSAAEIAAIPAAACNLLTVEPEPIPAAEGSQGNRCRYEIPAEFGNGSLGVSLRRSTALLYFTDGRVALETNNTPAAAGCEYGYRVTNATQLELEAGACLRINAGQATLRLVFGCGPGELTAQAQ